MSALLDSLTADFHGDATRRVALDALLHDGLPQRAESWKYTSLRQLERRSFVPARHVAVEAMQLAAIPEPRIVFVNGQFDAALSNLSGLIGGIEVQALSQHSDSGNVMPLSTRSDEPFARLNATLAREGVSIHVDADAQMDTPLHLVHVGSVQSNGDAAWHLRHRITLGEGASLSLVEHELAVSEHAHLGNVVMHVQLAERAKLGHVRLQDASARASVFARTDATLAQDAGYQRIDLELGAALSRHELNVQLQGDRAALTANGVLLADGRRHVDTRLGIDHIARDTRCNLTWRGLAGQRGKAVFHGGITIHAGADGSEAELSNKNLLLSADAEIDTQPVLVIHADEVKAAHGATVGQLDATALFYLRSRGLPEAQARALLTGAFCREVVNGIADSSTHAVCATALERALARVGA